MKEDLVHLQNNHMVCSLCRRFIFRAFKEIVGQFFHTSYLADMQDGDKWFWQQWGIWSAFHERELGLGTDNQSDVKFNFHQWVLAVSQISQPQFCVHLGCWWLMPVEGELDLWTLWQIGIRSYPPLTCCQGERIIHRFVWNERNGLTRNGIQYVFFFQQGEYHDNVTLIQQREAQNDRIGPGIA